MISDGDAVQIRQLRGDLEKDSDTIIQMAIETGVNDLLTAATQTRAAALCLANILTRKKAEENEAAKNPAGGILPASPGGA